MLIVLKSAKGAAKIHLEKMAASSIPFYDSENEKFIKPDQDLDYVVFHGDFNESVALAESYYTDQDHGRYNLFSITVLITQTTFWTPVVLMMW